MLGPPGAISSFCFSSSPHWAAVSPALDLALIILGTAASHIVLGCLWEYLTCWFQAKHFVGSSSWFPQITGIGSLQDMLVQCQLMTLRRRRWGGIGTQGLSTWREGDIPVERWEHEKRDATGARVGVAMSS